MAIDENYKRRLERFIKVVADMQNEVDAGTILDEKNRAKYESNMKLSIPAAYITTLKLYSLATNGKKEDFNPYFADIAAVLAGFGKQVFREIIEKSGVKFITLDELAKQTEQTKTTENKITKDMPIKIVRGGNYSNNSADIKKEDVKDNSISSKISRSNDPNYYLKIMDYVEKSIKNPDQSKYGGK